MDASSMLDFIISHCDKNTADTTYRSLALKWLNLVLKDLQQSQEGFHWRFLEATGKLKLVADDFDYSLVTAFSDIDTEKTINVYDKINDFPLKYVDYNIFRQMVAKETDNGGDPRIFTIYAGNMLLWPVPDYTAITGTQTATTAFKLRDGTATFITDGVEVGMLATDIVAGVTALITAIDSEIALTLDTDIFTGAETYSINKCLHVDYVKKITAATDAGTTLLVSDKYERTVIDGILEFAYQFDPELGSAADQRVRYKDGLARMIKENQQIIAENKRSISHRAKHNSGNMDARKSILFPLSSENMGA